MQGSDFTFEDLEGVREAADELLVEAGLEPLPSSAFVFVMHQGYQFYYFQDGAVFYFKEGDKATTFPTSFFGRVALEKS